MVPPQQHVCNGLARPADASILLTVVDGFAAKIVNHVSVAILWAETVDGKLFARKFYELLA